MRNIIINRIKHVNSGFGFTILELLVVFSLISIITGAGFVSLVSYSRKQVVTESVADIKQTIQLARFSALSSVKPEECQPNDQLLSYTVNFCISGNPSCLAEPGYDYQLYATCGTQPPIFIKSYKLPQNVTFLATSTCQNVTFKAINPGVTGVPCDLKIAGLEGNVTLLIDVQGYVYKL